MKKTFSFHAPGKADARILDSIKHDVRKYVQRERRKPLPEGFGRWEFACRVGPAATEAESVLLPEISGAIDRVAATGVDAVYVEVNAQPAANAPSETGSR